MRHETKSVSIPPLAPRQRSAAAMAQAAGAVLAIAVLLAWGAEAVAGAPAGPSGAGTASAKQPKSVLELIVLGGPVMIPIGLLSIVAVAVAFERFIGLQRNRIIPTGFMEGLGAAFGPEGSNTQAAMAYCARTPSPIGNVIRAGILKLGRRLEIVEKAVEDAAALEVSRMRRGLETLAVIGTVEPLLGLLGTIYGMIGAFQKAAMQGLGRAEVLASGIYEALVTTAAGLTIAVPTLLVYYILLGRVGRLAEQIEHVANDFLDQCHEELGTAESKQPAAGISGHRGDRPAPNAGL